MTWRNGSSWAQEEFEDDEMEERLGAEKFARGHVTKLVREAASTEPIDVQDEIIDDIMANWERFTVWTPHKTWLGRHYSIGEWKINLKALDAVLCEFTVPIVPPPPPLPSVDSVLASLHFNPPGGRPREPYFHELRLTKEERNRCYEQLNKIHAAWPRNCRQCGKEYRPRTREDGSDKSCRACLGPIKPMKARECRDCHAQFTPRSGAQRSCDACRAPKRKSGKGKSNAN